MLSDHSHLESGYDYPTQTVANNTPICPNATKAAWLMYRPEGDDTVPDLFQDTTTESWHQGSRFEGPEIGSGFAMMETPLRPQSLDSTTRLGMIRSFSIGIMRTTM